MKNKRSVLFLFSAACICWLLSSCKGDSAFAGGSMIDEQTTIISAYADTFLVTSHLIQPEGIITSPDSFLLGEVETSYGTMHAEILTQLTSPLGFAYPDNAVIDSIDMFVYYGSWVGDGNAPLELEIRLMDQNPLYYWQRYLTNFNISDYCSMDESTRITATNRIVVASHPTDSIRQASGKYVPFIRFRTTPEFVEQFGSIRSFSSQDIFDKQFKGLYLRSLFGGSTVLNVSDIGMAVFFHFTYNRAGRDTTVNDSKFFYSNSEVRQLNHIVYRDSAEMYERLSADPLRNYVISPAGMYTGLHIPVRSIAERVFSRINQVSPSRPYINSARVLVHVENVYENASATSRDEWERPANQMMLIDSAALNDFFIRRNLTSDTVAILSSLTSQLDSVGERDYYYSFDMATILMNQFRKRDLNDFYFDDSVMASLPDTVNMVLVPVTTASTTSSTSGATSLIGIDEQQTISTTIISASSAVNPMRLEVVYSGFPYNW